MRNRLLSALAIATTVMVATTSQAQNQGFALNRFDVSEVGSDWFSGDSLDLRGELRPGARITADWAHRPLLRYDEDGNEAGVVIENQLFGHVAFGAIIANRLRLAVNLPLLLAQTGSDLMVGTQTYGAEEGFALGDLRAAADVRLVGEYGEFFSLAIGAQVHLPTGDRAAFSGDGSVRLAPRLMIAGDLGPLAYSTRFSFIYRPQDDGFGAVPTGSEVAFVATAGIRALDGKLLIGPELWGSTLVSNNDGLLARETTPFELLAGVHYRAGDWKFGVGAGPGLNRGIGAPQVRVVGLLEFIPDASDRDKDGILDKDDACPDIPGPPNKDPKLHGCPDRDKDTIIDPKDACPDVAGPFNADPSKNGCPDRDGDGIFDQDDACPDDPGPANEDPTKNGCPDRDGDGIFDQVDACPDEPGPANEDPTKHGCPDRDGDGIFDHEDACPDEPGVASDDPAKHGCPLAFVEKDQIKITERIEFETDKAKIRPESNGVLNAVLQVLAEHPEIQEVRVEGHTDNVGAPSYNLGLSRRRAASVVKWLVTHGIDEARLTPEGFGLERPIASNTDRDGRQTNRRVEFHITQQDDSTERGSGSKPGSDDRGTSSGADDEDDIDDDILDMD